MYRLVESIRIENKQIHHLDLHNERFNRSRKIMFGQDKALDLNEYIHLPGHLSDQRYKCRVTTPDGIRLEVEITLYEQRKIESLQLLEQNTIEYSIKTDHRELLNKAYAMRGACDDIIIVKNKHLTDAWAANLILFDGNRWFTPDTPLLKGIQREFLLQSKIIESKKIMVADLNYFQKIRLINALMDFDRAPEISIDQIKH